MTKRAAFAKTATRLLGRDESLVVLLGDIGIHSFKDAFDKYPSRCINAGICEQAGIGMAAGLSMSAMYPVYSTIEAFLLRRAYEQLRLDFGEQKLAGLFVGIGGANEYAKLGPTHQCREGFNLAALIPGMDVLMPRDDSDVEQSIEWAVENRKLAYIRLEETH